MIHLLTMVALAPFLIFFLWFAFVQTYLLVCEYQESREGRANRDINRIARIIQMQAWARSDPVIDEMCES